MTTNGVVRLRYILRPREVTERQHLEVLSVYRDHGVVPKDSRDDNFNRTPVDLSRYQEVRVGDLVVNKMKAWQGSLAVSRYHGIVSPDYLVCSVASSVDSQFLHYLLRSSRSVWEFQRRSKGIRPAQWRLYWEDLADVPVSLPAEKEQRRIADFLDAATARIDLVLTSIARMQECLEEKRLAVIESLLPAGGLVPLKYLARIVDTEHKTAPHVPGGGYWIAGTSSVRNGSLVHSELYETDAAGYRDWTKRMKPASGDVLLTREAPVGEAAIYRTSRKLAIGQRMVLLRCNSAVLRGEYLLWSLLGCRVQEFIKDVTQGSLHPHLNMEDIGNIPIAGVSENHQRTLAEEISRQVSEVEQLMAMQRRLSAILAERRHSLITAAVTGQLDPTTSRGVDL